MPIKIIFRSGLVQTFIVNPEMALVDFIKSAREKFGPIKKTNISIGTQNEN